MKATAMGAMLLLLPILVQAQELLSGRVTNAAGQPLEGVSVFLPAMHQAAFTDNNGEFQLELSGEGPYRIYFQYLGYERKELLVEGTGSALSVQMKEAFLGLPEVVVSSSSLTGGMLHPEKKSGSGHYIGPERLERFSYTDINRLLRQVPGVQLRGEDGWGLRPNIGIRGSGSERSSKVALMEDGILIAPAPYSAPAAYYFPVIGKMHAIELSKGSDNIRFGPFTTGGALNLITRPVPDKASAGAGFSIGEYGYREANFHAGSSFGRLGVIAEAYRVESDGFKKLDGGGDTGFEKSDYSIKLRYHHSFGTSANHIFELKGGLADEDSDETYLGLSASDFEDDPYRRYKGSALDRMLSDHNQLYFRYILQSLAGWELQLTAYRNEFARNWFKLDKLAVDGQEAIGISGLLSAPETNAAAFELVKGLRQDGSFYLKNNNREYLSRGLQLHWRNSYTASFAKISALAGMRVHYDEMDRFQWVDEYRLTGGDLSLTQPGEPGTESNRIQSANALSGFVEFSLQRGEWTLSPGLRYEGAKLKREDFGKSDPERTGENLETELNEVHSLIPALGLNYSLGPRQRLFAGVHKGFAPPGTNEESEPESSVNYELGYNLNTENTFIQTALFWHDYRNLLGSDLAASGGTGSGELYNGGAATVRGIEVEARHLYQLSGGSGLKIPIEISYSYTDAQFDSSFESDFEQWGEVMKGDPIPYVAKHQFAFTTGLQTGSLSLAWSQLYGGALPVDTESELDSWWVSDLALSWQLRDGMYIRGSVQNLFDKAYALSDRPAGLRPGLPRFFRLGLDLQL